MKIALVNNYYYVRGGSERVLFDDLQALLTAGHDVRPFAPQDNRNEPAGSASFFPIVTDYSAATGLGLAKAASDLVYSRSVGKAFGAFLDDFRPQIIHCHNIYGRLTTAVLDESKRRGIPIVLTVHDQKLTCPAYLGLREGKPCQLCQDGAYWRCLRWKCHKQSTAASLVYTIEAYFNRYAGKYDAVARFLCPSHFMQKSLIDSGISVDRTIYHPNALNPDDYSPQYESGQYVLYVGRLSAEKGIFTMLNALEGRRIPLEIAGSGPLEEDVRRLIVERNLPVRMEGYCSGERLAGLYRNAAFTILPSEWYENASMAALESLAYGKPVLASAIGGNPEIVADGATGRLFSPNNVDELAKALDEMWADREGTCDMGRNGRRLIENKFSQATRLASLMAIYADLHEKI
jgi:glycosyltransferase involved in cell wall biosynthesis